MSEQVTLYKLMVLYMLKKVNFPLTYSQMTEFFLEKYTNYFTFQQVIGELGEAKLIKSETIRNISYYEITREGEEALYFFQKKVSEAILDDINQYLKENKFKLRNETGIIADYYPGNNQDYIVHCVVKEGRATLLEVNLSVPDQNQAASMCNHWEKQCQDIYSYIMKKMMEKPQDSKKS